MHFHWRAFTAFASKDRQAATRQTRWLPLQSLWCLYWFLWGNHLQKRIATLLCSPLFYGDPVAKGFPYQWKYYACFELSEKNLSSWPLLVDERAKRCPAQERCTLTTIRSVLSTATFVTSGSMVSLHSWVVVRSPQVLGNQGIVRASRFANVLMVLSTWKPKPSDGSFGSMW